MGTEVIGTIELHDKEKGRSERTSAQVLNFPSFDSRLYPHYSYLNNRVIRELRKDPTVQLARWAVLSPMVHTPWMYEKNKYGTKEMVDHLETTFKPIRDLLLTRMVFGTLDFGWQPFEVVLKPEDGYIYIDEFKPLLQDFTTILIILENGRFGGFVNEPPGYKTASIVPLDYSLNTNFDTEGTDWYGLSVFNNLLGVLNSWGAVEATSSRYDKKIAGATWVVHFPVGKTMYKGILTNNDEIATSLLSTLEASGGIAIPDEIKEYLEDGIDRETKGKWMIELISAKGSNQTTFISRQKYLDALKMRAFGLTERSVLEGSHGTKAEADVHGDVSLSIVDSRHRLLCTHLNLGPVQRTLALNFGKKYAYAACIKPAPLMDNKFKTIKEIYTRILSDGDALAAELENIDIKALRDELGISTGTGLKIVRKEEKIPGPVPVPKLAS